MRSCGRLFILFFISAMDTLVTGKCKLTCFRFIENRHIIPPLLMQFLAKDSVLWLIKFLESIPDLLAVTLNDIFSKLNVTL